MITKVKNPPSKASGKPVMVGGATRPASMYPDGDMTGKKHQARGTGAATKGGKFNGC